MYHLAMKPAVGGNPPSDSRNTAIITASTGRENHRPVKSCRSPLGRSSVAMAEITPKAPRLATAYAAR